MINPVSPPSANLPDASTFARDHGRGLATARAKVAAVAPAAAAVSRPGLELLELTPCRVSKSYAPAVALVASGAAEWVGTAPFETLVAINCFRTSARLAGSGD